MSQLTTVALGLLVCLVFVPSGFDGLAQAFHTVIVHVNILHGGAMLFGERGDPLFFRRYKRF